MGDCDYANTFVLTNEDGEETTFVFLALLELEGNEYVVAYPEEDDGDEVEVVVLETVEVNEEAGYETYVTVDDFDYARVYKYFKERYKDIYAFQD